MLFYVFCEINIVFNIIENLYFMYKCIPCIIYTYTNMKNTQEKMHQYGSPIYLYTNIYLFVSAGYITI